MLINKAVFFCPVIVWLVFFSSAISREAFAEAPANHLFKIENKQPDVLLHLKFSVVDGHSELLILSPRIPEQYKAVILKDPDQLVLDISNADIPGGGWEKAINRKELKMIRASGHDGRVRIVFDLPEHGAVMRHVEQVKNGLKVILQLKKPDWQVKKITPGPLQDTLMPVSTTAETQSPVKKIDINLFKADLKDFFAIIADASGREIVLDPGVKGQVTMKLPNVSWETALDTIKNIYGLKLVRQDGKFYVYELVSVQK